MTADATIAAAPAFAPSAAKNARPANAFAADWVPLDDPDMPKEYAPLPASRPGASNVGMLGASMAMSDVMAWSAGGATYAGICGFWTETGRVGAFAACCTLDRKTRAARWVASLRAAISLCAAAFAAAARTASGPPAVACAFATALRTELMALTTHKTTKTAMRKPDMRRLAYDVGGFVGVVGGAPPG